jgi:hypothetical protein
MEGGTSKDIEVEIPGLQKDIDESMFQFWTGLPGGHTAGRKRREALLTT